MKFISIVLPVYKNEDYVEKSIESVLEQSYSEFELIIVLNGMTKFNEKLKAKYTDKRIKYISIPRNIGSYWGTETGIQASNGDYIAFIGSDDYWAKDKLAIQIEALEDDIGSVFFYPTMINETDDRIFRDKLFALPNEFNGSINEELNYLFYHMNGLCWSSALIEKKLLEKSSWSMARFKQLCDKAHWINCLKKKRIICLEHRDKVFYRIHVGGNECLNDIDITHNRVILENYYLLRQYADFNLSQLKDIFGIEYEGRDESDLSRILYLIAATRRITDNKIVNKSLNLLGSNLWMELLGKPEVKEKESLMDLVRSEDLVNYYIPNAFDVTL